MFPKITSNQEGPETPRNQQQQRYLDTVGAAENLQQRYSRQEMETRAQEDGVEMWQECLLTAHRLESTLALDEEHKDKFGGRDEKIVTALRQMAEEEALSKGVPQEAMDEYRQSLENPAKE